MTENRSNPYPGPRPFTDKEFGIFAGRDHEISEVSSLIQAHRAVLLYARSGAGKSSLLNAGLRHALDEKGVRVKRSARVGIPAAPLRKVRNIYTYSALSTLLPDFSPEEEFFCQATLAEALQRFPQELDTRGEPRLRVIPFDQFEELFSTHPERWQNRREFFQEIAEALRADASLRVLFLLREDYLADFAELAVELSDRGRTRYRLDLLREREALHAVQRPLEGTHWSFAPGVAESLVKDLTLIKSSASRGDGSPISGEFVEPVQLQAVCFELLERLPREGKEITAKDLFASGGVDEALRKFYGRVVRIAVQETQVKESVLRAWFRDPLITPADTRGLVFQDRESTGGIPNAVVEVLEREHIVHAELRPSGRWFELTHDRLIPPILRANREFQLAGNLIQPTPAALTPESAISGTALCLSGGGYRAMLFHLGALWRLNELQYLSKLDRVSSVSGGSITNGVLAMNWNKLGFDASGFAQDFDRQLTQPIRGMAAQTIDVVAVQLGIFGGVSKQIANKYNGQLYHNANLADLPDEPRFLFTATSLQTGALWNFSKPYMGDYKVGLVRNPDVELAMAVTASSAVPPILSPCTLHLDPESFDAGTPPAAGIKLPDFRQQAVLADGGICDNLGLETAWKRHKTILVSDGNGILGPDPNPAHDPINQSARALSVTSSQSVTLRRRSIVELFTLGVRNGSYWGIASNIQNYDLPDALVCPVDITTKLAQTPARLAAIADELQDQLIDWGYAVCDAAMRKHMVPSASAPERSPYGTFRKP